jgi:hypothetical protein
MTEQLCTKSIQMPTAIPMGDNKWLRKTVTVHYLNGLLAKVDGIQVNIDHGSNMVHDTLYFFRDLKGSVTKYNFVRGRLVGTEDFPESVEEINEPPQSA